MKKLLPLFVLFLLSINLFAQLNSNYTVSGTVTDYHDQVLEGVEITFTDGLTVFKTVTSDATGAFSASFYGNYVKAYFQHPQDLYIPAVYDENWEFQMDQTEGTKLEIITWAAPIGNNEEMEVKLRENFISGTVTKQTNGPAAEGIRVSIFSADDILLKEVSTDVNGHYNSGALAPISVASDQYGEPGVVYEDVKVVFKDPGDLYLPLYFPQEPDIVMGGGLSNEEALGSSRTFIRGTNLSPALLKNALTGYLTDAGTSPYYQPIQGIKVIAQSAASTGPFKVDPVAVAFTQQDGSFELELHTIPGGTTGTPHDVKILFEDPNGTYLAEAYDDVSVNDKPEGDIWNFSTPVPRGSDPLSYGYRGIEVIAELEKDLIAVSGYVSGPIANNLAGLEGIMVEIYGGADNLQTTVFTDQEGAYEVPLSSIDPNLQAIKIYFSDPELEYISQAYPSRNQLTDTKYELINSSLPVGIGSENIDAQLTKNAISGSVYNSTAGLEGILVIAKPASSGGPFTVEPFETTVTQSDGTFELSSLAIPNGTFDGMKVYFQDPVGRYISKAYGNTVAAATEQEAWDNATIVGRGFSNVHLSLEGNVDLSIESDQEICADESIHLSGTVPWETDYITWGGAGSFEPDIYTLEATYTPTATEVEAGSATLTLAAYINEPGSTTGTTIQTTITISPIIDWYLDADGDGYGDPSSSILSCETPAGYVDNNLDCNDADPSSFPAFWYLDADMDGYGDAGSFLLSCDEPDGQYVLNNNDIDDFDSNVYPDAPEICDGIDNDGDGDVDEGVKTTYYRDADGDGFGDPQVSVEACSQPEGYVLDNTDFDDSDASVYPGAPELCDGKDNDGNGEIDDGATIITHATVDKTLTPVDNVVELTVLLSDPGATNLSIDWGDGSYSNDLNVSGGSISLSHAYGLTGVYSLTITAGSNGCTSSVSYNYIVVYDPFAGFVTGGGWIDSPLGALKQDPDATGKANFGFVAKYKKGQTVPSGNTEFQFKAGFLNFKSSNFEWLVVAGNTAKFKGEGTINGAGSYGFMISASDGGKTGEPDKFRIKIWDVPSEMVVYDNQMDSNEEDPMTAIAGGSIVVHSPKTKSTSSIDLIYENDNIDSLELLVFPNPTSGKLNIMIHNSHTSELTYSLLDITGKVMVTGTYLELENMQIDVSPLKPGMYFLIAQDNVNMVIEKIMVH